MGNHWEEDDEIMEDPDALTDEDFDEDITENDT